MSHTYKVDTAGVLNDVVTLTGSVDGVAVTISFWLSALNNMTQQQKKLFIAALMLDAAFPQQPTDLSGTLGGTFVI